MRAAAVRSVEEMPDPPPPTSESPIPREDSPGETEPGARGAAERSSIRLPRRFRRSALTSYLKTGSTAVITLVMTPFLVTGLGTEGFGVWVLVTSFVAYRDLLGLGFQSAVPKHVAEYSGLGDRDRLLGSIATAFWFLTACGAVALLLGLGVAVAFPHLFELSPELRTPAQVLVVVMAVDFALSLPGGAFGGTLIGLQRFDLLNATLVAVAVGQAIGWAIVLALGGGLVPLGVVTATLSVAGQVWRYLIARGLVPGLSLSPRIADRGILGAFTRLSIWYWVLDATFVIGQRVDTIVVSLILGVPAAGVYAIGQKLAIALAQLVQPITTIFFPHSAELLARRDTAGLRDSLVTGTRVMLAVAAPSALTLAILAGPIIEAWVGDGFSGSVAVTVFLAAAVPIRVLTSTGEVMLEGMGRPRIPALLGSLGALLNLGLSVALANLIGLEGVALATLLATALVNFLLIVPYVNRQFGLRIREFAGPIVVAHAPAAVLAALVGWWLTAADPANVIAIAGIAVAIVGVYAAVFAATGLDRRERRAVLERLRRPGSQPSVSRP